MKRLFWVDKTVLITGHNGFKGKWLTKYLDMTGARVIGLALPEESNIEISQLGLSKRFKEILGDITDKGIVEKVKQYEPEVIFHLAAQSIVKNAHEFPVETFTTNVLGTANLLQTLSTVSSVKVIIVVTSDKVYHNIEILEGYRETDPLMGSEVYSCSKVCQEQVAKAFFERYFKNKNIGMATARASNCFGGGDYHFDRLIPYLQRCSFEGKTPEIRNKDSVRPWQYVLDLLNGYMCLAEYLWENRNNYLESFNFGPDDKQLYTVENIANMICGKIVDNKQHSFLEDKLLFISSEKSYNKLGWFPIFDLRGGLQETTSEYREYFEGIPPNVIYEKHIKYYIETMEGLNDDSRIS